MKNSIRVLSALAVTLGLTVSAAAAEKSKGVVPTKLFGVELGRVYQLAPNLLQHNLPVAKVTEVKQGRGLAYHVLFQPQKNYEAFPYKVLRDSSDQKSFESRFHVAALPLVPDSTKSFDEVENLFNGNALLSVEVTRIDWGTLRDSKSAESYREKLQDYSWARDLCAVFEADIGLKPKVTDLADLGRESAMYSYQCVFANGEQELEVSSVYGREVVLQFSREVSDRKHDAVKLTLNKLLAKKIRPY